MNLLNEYPSPPVPLDRDGNPVAALGLLHNYRDSIVNWEPNSYTHTPTVMKERAKKKAGRANRKVNRGK